MQGFKVVPPPAATLSKIIFLTGKAAKQAVWACFGHLGSQSWRDANHWSVVSYYATSFGKTLAGKQQPWAACSRSAKQGTLLLSSPGGTRRELRNEWASGANTPLTFRFSAVTSRAASALDPITCAYVAFHTDSLNSTAYTVHDINSSY